MNVNFWRKYADTFIVSIFKNFTARRLLWVLLFYTVATGILGISLLPGRLQLEEGQPSPRDFEAQQSIVYESEVLTEQAREQAARDVEPALKVDKAVLTQMEGEIRSYFNQIKNVRADKTLNEAEKIIWIKEKVGLVLPGSTIKALLTADDNTLEHLEKQAVQIMRRYMEPGVQQAALPTARQNIVSEVELLAIDKSYQEVLKAIYEGVNFQETLVYDLAGTAQKRQEARAQVGPVQVKIQKGEKIAGKGDILTAAKIEALQRLGLLKARTTYANFLGLSIFVLVAFVLIAFFLYQYRKEFLANEPYIVLLGLLLILGLVMARILSSFNGTTDTSMILGYLAPTAAVTMLIAILLDTKLAIFIAVILGLFTGVVNGYQFQFAAVAVVGGVTGVYSVSKLSQRGDLMRAALYVMLVNVLTILALGMMLNYTLYRLAIALSLGIANGLLSSVATIGTLPFLETAFGITTSVKLLELSNPNQPILKRLLMEAPGTYHHSILVGNLAESAADAVGADSLLARVGAYYHDIGKIRRPYFFIENQIHNSENPHDKLAPTLSTLIITSHVKDGLELAKENRLPKVIADFIAQHHGTSLISFFYHKALENEKAETISEADFRYEGPKPKSKEAAIVMLADAVEAGVRSLKNPTPGRMEGFVRKVIKEKLEDGQLEECELTFRELDTIAQAFVRILSGIFHSRIEYPDQVLKEIERRKAKDAAARK
ncbi:HD family phosphohydrolase [Zhaonella formicivorans]|uniref:HD family phosphohydrolase n=1 Tax=Zhaonella formicivorans TaxID=2528593 RepID=UPI0010D05E75|nr:HDIG domain-containing metalloprotein [Zhaonella formicivorans]